MKRVFTGLAALLALFVLLVGCENPFTYNAFAVFDAPDSPQSADEVSAIVASGGVQGLLDELGNLTQSSSFYQDLIQQDLETTDGPSALDQILTELTTAYSTSTDTAIVQQAALAAADIELNTSSGGEVVDSLVTVAFGMLSGTSDGSGTDSGGGLDTMVTDVINTAFGDLTDEQFNETLSSLVNAADAYAAFGSTLESGTASSDVNIEAIAQDAVVAMAFKEIVAETGDPDLTKDELTAIAASAADPEDPNFATNSAIFSNAIANLDADPSFGNILSASGLADLFALGGTA